MTVEEAVLRTEYIYEQLLWHQDGLVTVEIRPEDREALQRVLGMNRETLRRLTADKTPQIQPRLAPPGLARIWSGLLVLSIFAIGAAATVAVAVRVVRAVLAAP